MSRGQMGSPENKKSSGLPVFMHFFRSGRIMRGSVFHFIFNFNKKFFIFPSFGTGFAHSLVETSVEGICQLKYSNRKRLIA